VFLQSYTQHAVSCAKCSTFLGWQFERSAPIRSSKAGSTGKAAAAAATLQHQAGHTGAPATTQTRETGDVDPRVLAAKVTRLLTSSNWGGFSLHTLASHFLQVDAQAAAEAVRLRGPVRVKDYSSDIESEVFEPLKGKRFVSR
jgi:hypothetical protein